MYSLPAFSSSKESGGTQSRSQTSQCLGAGLTLLSPLARHRQKQQQQQLVQQFQQQQQQQRNQQSLPTSHQQQPFLTDSYQQLLQKQQQLEQQIRSLHQQELHKQFEQRKKEEIDRNTTLSQVSFQPMHGQNLQEPLSSPSPTPSAFINASSQDRQCSLVKNLPSLQTSLETEDDFTGEYDMPHPNLESFVSLFTSEHKQRQRHQLKRQKEQQQKEEIQLKLQMQLQQQNQQNQQNQQQTQQHLQQLLMLQQQQVQQHRQPDVSTQSGKPLTAPALKEESCIHKGTDLSTLATSPMSWWNHATLQDTHQQEQQDQFFTNECNPLQNYSQHLQQQHFPLVLNDDVTKTGFGGDAEEAPTDMHLWQDLAQPPQEQPLADLQLPVIYDDPVPDFLLEMPDTIPLTFQPGLSPDWGAIDLDDDEEHSRDADNSYIRDIPLSSGVFEGVNRNVKTEPLLNTSTTTASSRFDLPNIDWPTTAYDSTMVESMTSGSQLHALPYSNTNTNRLLPGVSEEIPATSSAATGMDSQKHPFNQQTLYSGMPPPPQPSSSHGDFSKSWTAGCPSQNSQLTDSMYSRSSSDSAPRTNNEIMSADGSARRRRYRKRKLASELSENELAKTREINRLAAQRHRAIAKARKHEQRDRFRHLETRNQQLLDEIREITAELKTLRRLVVDMYGPGGSRALSFLQSGSNDPYLGL
eukprot:gene8608-1022_t